VVPETEIPGAGYLSAQYQDLVALAAPVVEHPCFFVSAARIECLAAAALFVVIRPRVLALYINHYHLLRQVFADEAEHLRAAAAAAQIAVNGKVDYVGQRTVMQHNGKAAEGLAFKEAQQLAYASFVLENGVQSPALVGGESALIE